VCIIIHDWGHWGTNYLDNLDEKHDHWILGATIARALFGEKYGDLCAGHCDYSGEPKSIMYKADKYAFYIAPLWWLTINGMVEPKMRGHFKSARAAARDFKASVSAAIESGHFGSNHKFYLERVNGKKTNP
jgi:hypothetical protein